MFVNIDNIGLRSSIYKKIEFQDFFNALYDELGIALENIVYYKDETHYFVMTTKKHSLLDRKVLKKVNKQICWSGDMPRVWQGSGLSRGAHALST